MALVTAVTYNPGTAQHEFAIDDLHLPPIAEGTTLQASVVDAGQGIKLVIIVVPAASGPSAPSEAPAPAAS